MSSVSVDRVGAACWLGAWPGWPELLRHHAHASAMAAVVEHLAPATASLGLGVRRVGPGEAF